ncbi:hypothetical protein, partial [Sphingobium sp. Ndbn-10]|uniref:hypothetical protein n=1 Tax=Sphingobium sp. Ndbn-10 TaxID=1667223 RepID=UPI00147FD5BC
MMSIAVKVDGVVMKAAVLAFHAAIFIFCLVLSGRKIVLNQKYFSAPFFIWLVLVVVSVLRGEGVAAYALLLTYFFVALYLAYSNFRVSVSDYVFRGIFIVVSMDFLLMCAGVVSHLDYINGGNYGDALLLRAVGITHERVLPFFATGFQSYAILAGALILYLVSDFFQRRRLSFFSATGILISSVMLLVTDARGAVLYLLISLVLSLVFSRRFKGVVSISSGRMSLV